MANKNVFTTFRKKSKLVNLNQEIDNNVVMVSCINDVMLCGNFTIKNYSAGGTLATLESECAPTQKIALPICYYDGAHKTGVMIINPNGSIVLNVSIADGELYTNGISFHINGNIYKEV